MKKNLSRRGFVTGAAAIVGGAALAGQNEAEAADTAASDIPGEDYKIKSGRIRHSVMGWCFNPMPTPDLIGACHKMGMPAMEGIGREHYPLVKKLGMQISLVSSHGFANGPLSSKNRAMCIAKLREGIDVAVKFGSPSVITFTGMREKGTSDKQADKNCVEVWKEVIGYAEEKKITLCLEHLNSRDDTHPMKGHPGYYGDDVDHCVELIRQVDSPNMKLLFDVYHVQIMNGDVIRRIGQYHELIGHYHTAGVPGRAELVDSQEVNYPAIMHAILKTGYKGYVAHEFIPTWEDKLAALRHGVQVCDV